MAALTGNKIKDSYLGLLKTTNSGILTSSFVRITDGGGNNTQLYLSNAAIRFYDAYTFPNADGTSGQVLSTDGSGNLTFSESSDNQTLEEVLTSGNTATLAILSTADGNTFGSTTFDDAVTGTTANFTTSVTSPSFIGDIDGALIQQVKAAEALSKGDVVYISGGTGDNPEVSKAKADSATTMAALGIIKNNISEDAIGECITSGELTGLGTLLGSFATGDDLYVSATTAGALVTTAPTGVANLIQKIGKVIKGGNGGALTVLGAFRTNASPNLPSGILLGDTTNVSTAITDGSVGQILSTDGSGSYSFVDSTNDVTKTGTITANQIAVWNDSTDELRSDPTLSIYEGDNNVPNHSIYLYQPNGENPPVNLYSYNIGGGHLDDVTGIHNTGFGYRNLFTVTTGQENSAFGYESLRRLTSGSYNSAFGKNSLNSLTTGSSNTAFGWQSLAAITTKSGNTAFGSQVLANANGTLVTEAVNNTGLGSGALYDNTTGSYNVAVGHTALTNVTTGSNNVAIGNTSGSAITTGSNNVTLGGYSNGSSDEGIITLSNGTGARRISVNNSGKITFHGYGSATHTGTLAKTLGVDSNGNVIEVDAAGGDVSISGTPVANQIAIWTDASTIKGDATFTIDTSGGINLSQTLNSYNIGGGNIANVTGTNNTGFGKNNLTILTSGFYNVAVGYESSENITTGHRNVSVGSQSLSSAQGATDNTAVGEGALYTNISGDGNVAIGRDALRFFTGGNNTSIGAKSLFGVNGTSTGIGNTAIGYNSGNAITTGSYNVIIGSNTGSTIATSSNNIIISDGSGNIRQSFDINGDATFNGGATFSGSVDIYKTTDSQLQIKSLNEDATLIINSGADGVGGANREEGFIKFYQDNADFFTLGKRNNGQFVLTDHTASQDVITFQDGGGILIQPANNLTTFSGVVNIPVGAEATPSLIFAGDSDSGMWHPAANTLAFSTFGNERLRISSGGDTTITTTTNQGGLTITSATDNTTLRLINTATSGKDWRLYSTGGSSGLGAGKLFIKVGTTETSARLVSFVDDGSNINVGIGTTSPAYLLTASGTNLPYIASVTANVQTVIASDETNGRAYIGTRTNHPIAFVVDGNEKMRISSGGITTLTNSSTSNTLVLNGTSGYSYLRTQQSGVDKWAIGNVTSVSDNLEFYNGSTRLTISSGGLVTVQNGIKFGGTPSPAYDVAATTLDAYEEGTSTIYFRATGQNPTPTATANYTRVGNFVYYSFEVTLNALSASNAYFDGLPYLPASFFAKSAFYVGFNTSTNSNGGNIPTSGTYAGTGFFYQRDSLSQAVWNTGTTYLTVSGSYQV